MSAAAEPISACAGTPPNGSGQAWDEQLADDAGDVLSVVGAEQQSPGPEAPQAAAQRPVAGEPRRAERQVRGLTCGLDDELGEGHPVERRQGLEQPVGRHLQLGGCGAVPGEQGGHQHQRAEHPEPPVADLRVGLVRLVGRAQEHAVAGASRDHRAELAEEAPVVGVTEHILEGAERAGRKRAAGRRDRGERDGQLSYGRVLAAAKHRQQPEAGAGVDDRQDHLGDVLGGQAAGTPGAHVRKIASMRAAVSASSSSGAGWSRRPWARARIREAIISASCSSGVP